MPGFAPQLDLLLSTIKMQGALANSLETCSIVIVFQYFFGLLALSCFLNDDSVEFIG
jgi:hypothetical protein